VFSLIDGFEMDSYAKSGIIKNYPDLKNHLKRHFLSDTDLNTLNKYLSRFIEYIETNLSSLRLNEQTDKNE
jgi:glucosamine 6-phosphate synthetase-like amidotransferase/phosphosugar isomerase protein